MNTLETLIAARALIAEPEGWTQGALARRRDGFGTSFDGADVVAVCANGAICRVSDFRTYGGGVWLAAVEVLVANILADEMPEGDFPSQVLARFNDRRSHTEVLALFDRAIERQRTIDALTSVPSEVRAPAFVGA